MCQGMNNTHKWLYYIITVYNGKAKLIGIEKKNEEKKAASE